MENVRCKWMTALMILAASVLGGCSRADGGAPAPVPAAPRPTVVPIRPAGAVTPAAPPAGERRVSRTIEQDPDGDGIADSRRIITDTFDASGRLIQRTRDEDFDADGIVDARTTTRFDD